MSKPWPRWPLLLAALLPAGPSLAGGRLTPVSPSELTVLRARESTRSADSLAKLRAQKFQLGLNDRDDFRPSHVQTDRFGLTHTRFQQLHQGVPVWGGAAITHLDASGVALPVTAEGVLKGVRLNVHPALDAPAAVSVALLKLAAHGPPSVEPRAELIIYPQTRRVSLSPDKRLRQQNAVDFRQEVVGYKLAWHVHTELDNVQDGVVQEDFIIDAQTGWMIKKWNALETAAAVGTGHSEYSGDVPLSTYQNGSGQFELRDITRTGGVGLRTLDAHHLGTNSDPASAVLYTDADNTWGDGHNYVAGGSTTNDNGQTAAVDAHFGLLATWDFYQTIFGRYGIDDMGTPTFNRVHISTGYNNAYWSDSCYCMSYGDGSFSASNPYALLTVTALDVTGHELSHGVTAQTDALIYAGESGGLNEATSDIFGTMTEFWVRGGRNATIGDGGGNWLIGEDLNPYFPLRFMFKPSLDGASADAWYPGIENIDVHSSSGPMNRAFYFLSAGAEPASAGGYYSSDYLPAGMTGVGNDAAAAIWYRAVTTYLYPSSNYVSARTAALQSAADLFGASSKEYHAVENAFAAINVGYTAGTYDDRTPPSVSASVSGSAPTLLLNATATDNVGVTRVEFYVDGALAGTDSSLPFQVALDTTLQTNGAHQLLAVAFDKAGNYGVAPPVTFNVTNSFTQLLQDPGFELGGLGWEANPRGNINYPTSDARTGQGFVWLNGYGSVSTDNLYQDVAIPAGVSRAALTFWLNLTTEETGSSANDTFVVQVRDPSGTVLKTLATFSNLDASLSWVQRSFDVTEFAGQTVRIYLEGRENASLASSFKLDDFQLRVSSGVDTEKPRVTASTLVDPAGTQLGLFADVSDNGYVGAVQFLLDGTSLGSTPTSFARVLALASLTDGTHSLVARATDADGNTSDSAQVTFVVDSHRTQLVVNPSFENTDPGPMGTDAWLVESPYADSAIFYPIPGSNPYAHTGLSFFLMWNFPDDNDSTVRQTVTIPADATSAIYRFWLRLYSDAFSDGAAHHFFTAKVRSASGADLRTLATFSNLDDTGGDYREHVYDLSAYKGQTLQLFFDANTQQPAQNSGGSTEFFLDDVTLQATSTPDTQPPALSASVTGTYGPLQLNATVNDNVLTSSLEFLVDGTSVATLHDVNGSYSVPYDASGASNGPHLLKVNARDAAGNTSTVTVMFNVFNSTVSDTSAPTLTASVVGSFDSAKLHATASDDTGVTQVEFYVDDVFQGRVLSAPYERPFDTTPLSAGEHTLLAVAYDAYGHSTAATVKFVREGILLGPKDYVLLAALDSYTFTATPTAGVATPLTWRVDEGSICGSVTAAGVYTAPDGSGFCHVRVSSHTSPKLDAVATVRVYSADLNGDHVVDGEDMGLLAASYGSSEADAAYSASADLDASFSVDDLDVTLFVSQFGR